MSGNALPQDGTRRKMQSADGIDYTEINNYVHARTDEIIANIMAQLEYAGVDDSELPGGIVVVGGGARLPRKATSKCVKALLTRLYAYQTVQSMVPTL